MTTDRLEPIFEELSRVVQGCFDRFTDFVERPPSVEEAKLLTAVAVGYVLGREAEQKARRDLGLPLLPTLH